MLPKIFITAFIVMAIYASMAEGMVFGKVRVWLGSLNDFWKKPVFDCFICMVPYYGSIVYWIAWHRSWQEWLVVIIGAMGANTVFYLISVREL